MFGYSLATIPMYLHEGFSNSAALAHNDRPYLVFLRHCGNPFDKLPCGNPISNQLLSDMAGP